MLAKFHQLINEEEENRELKRRYRALLKVSKNVRSRKDKQKVRKAFDLAIEAHKDMRRKSGEPYVFHPIAVARIVAEEIGLGTTSIVCALLHDTVEDTELSINEVKKNFGDSIALLVDGVTKLTNLQISSGKTKQAENFRKFIVSMSKDLRILLVKLADRLHNMRTIKALSQGKQSRKAKETMESLHH